MDPQAQFCHNPDCTARGQLGLGNISVHSRKDRRYRCSTCGRTFAATRDTPFYRLKKSADLVTLVITLLCHGCPVQAIVAAFGLDERTVADWRDRAGRHAQQFHEHRVLRGQVELGHVQADELYVKAVARRLWMAMAMAVPSRLWLGGVVSERRDLTLIMTVVGMVRRAARSLRLLVCVDGLASYVTAFTRVFRDPVRTGRRGRPRLEGDPRTAPGPGDQASQRPSAGGRHPSGGAGDGRGDRLGVVGDRDGDGDQHVVHRAAQRDVPGVDVPAGASRPGDRPGRGCAERLDVPGGMCVQLLLGARQPAGRGRAGRSAEVGGADPGDGCGPDRPSLDDARVAEPADPSAAVGRPQAARATAEANSGPSASRGMTTVPCGATDLGQGVPLTSFIAK